MTPLGMRLKSFAMARHSTSVFENRRPYNSRVITHNDII